MNSLAAAVQRNRQRAKYTRLLSAVRLRVFDYEDAGPLQSAKYARVVRRIKRILKTNAGMA